MTIFLMEGLCPVAFDGGFMVFTRGVYVLIPLITDNESTECTDRVFRRRDGIRAFFAHFKIYYRFCAFVCASVWIQCIFVSGRRWQMLTPSRPISDRDFYSVNFRLRVDRVSRIFDFGEVRIMYVARIGR